MFAISLPHFPSRPVRLAPLPRVAALGVLGERERTALALVRGGLNYADIGVVMDCTREEAGALIYHAREQLRQERAR